MNQYVVRLLAAALLLLIFGSPKPARAAGSPFYEFKVVGKVGTPVLGADQITDQPNPNYSGQSPIQIVSINDNGRMVLGAKLLMGGGAVAAGLVAEDPATGELTILNNGGPIDFDVVQINNDNKVLGGWIVLRLYDAENPGTYEEFFETTFDDPVEGFREWFGLSRAEDGTIVMRGQVGTAPNIQPLSLYKINDGVKTRVTTLVFTDLVNSQTWNWPVVANGGRIAYKDGNQFDGNLYRYDAAGSPQVVATAPFGNFAQLGGFPGITDSGNAVAFSGVESSNLVQGIYMRVWDPAAPHLSMTTKTVIDTETPISFDDAGDPITFQQFDLLKSVSIVHQDVDDDDELDGDTFIIAFMATPSSASRDNPAAAGTPLLFSDQKGLWTIRVNAQRELQGTDIVLNPTGLLPVIQVGDVIDGSVVTNMFLNPSGILGRAERERDGTARQTTDGLPTPGDHYLGFVVETTDDDRKAVKAAKLDRDADGLPDHWERPDGGIDMDRDGEVDLRLSEMGATIDHKDLFLEVDWTPRRTEGAGTRAGWKNEPHPLTTFDLVDMFSRAPVTNPDNMPGIRLHVDAGPGTDLAGDPFSQNMGDDDTLLQGGDPVRTASNERPDLVHIYEREPVDLPGMATISFHDVKDRYFGTTDKRARELAFRYCVLADFFEDRPAASAMLEDGMIQYQPLFVGSATSRGICSQANLDVDSDGILDIFLKPGDAILVNATAPGGEIVPQVRTINTVNSSGIFCIRIIGMDFDPVPQPGDQFVIFSGDSGIGEGLIRGESTGDSEENQHSMPGNDFIVTLGAYGDRLTDNLLASEDELWRTMAHEFGHTLGLLHGGNDAYCQFNGDTNWSLMTYSHQMRYTPGDPLRVGGPNCDHYPDPNPLTSIREMIVINSFPPEFLADSPVAGVAMSYADTNSPLGFNEWDYIQKEPYGSFHFLGNTFFRFRGAIPNPHETYITVKDIPSRDLMAPSIQVGSPDAGVIIPIGGALSVTLQVVDDHLVDLVTVRFDKDGNGDTDGPGESVDAVSLGGDLYAADFPGVSGPDGPRSFHVTARDRSKNTTRLSPMVMVGSGSSGDTTPPSLLLQNPPEGADVAVGSSMEVEIQVGDDDDLGGSGVVDSVLVAFDLNGNGVMTDPGEERVAYEVAPTVYVAMFRDIGGAAGSRQIRVTAVDNWLNTAQATRNVNVIIRDEEPPLVSIPSPAPDAPIELGQVLTVDVNATDDIGVTRVNVRFDINGDNFISFCDQVIASSIGDDVYRAIFNRCNGGVMGALGPRTITVEVRDAAGNETVLTRDINVVAETQPPTIIFDEPEANTPFGNGGEINVEVEVTDNFSVNTVSVSFDIDGNGDTAGPGESIAATQLTSRYYGAVFSGLAGPIGTRLVEVRATDQYGNVGVATQPVRIARGVYVHGPLEGDLVPLASTLRVNMQPVEGITVTNITARFDVNGDGDTTDPGEIAQAIKVLDVLRDPRYGTSFANLSGPLGRRTLFVDTMDDTGGSASTSIDVVMVPFAGFQGLRSHHLASVPFLPELNNQGLAAGSIPEDFLVAGGLLYFTAKDDIGNRELWRTDGTQIGTFLVDDIDRFSGSGADNLTEYNGELYFTASDYGGSTFGFIPSGFVGNELWKTDGSRNSVTLVKDIYSPTNEINFTPRDSDPESLTVCNGLLYFSARDASTGRELWVSDGTEAGTMALDILAGTSGLDPEFLTPFNGLLYFAAASERQLWASDGTLAGTVMIWDGSPSKQIRDMAAAGTNLFLLIGSDTLWVSDGTTNGTRQIKDIRASGSSLPEQFTPLGNSLFFTADDGEHGRELWTSDGSEAGTYMVRDIYEGNRFLSSNPAGLTVYNGEVYFSALDPDGTELWKSDGTEAGTVQVANLIPAPYSSSPQNFAVFDGLLYFSADDDFGPNGRELWKTDGTRAGTVLVKDIAPGYAPSTVSPGLIDPRDSSPRQLIAYDGHLYFSAEGDYQIELWKSDGTAEGTVLLRNIAHGQTSPMVPSGNGLFLVTEDGVYGKEPWFVSTNTSLRLADIHPGVAGSHPGGMTLHDGNLLFIASDGVVPFTTTTNYGLYRSDGTEAGTVKLQSLANKADLLFPGFQAVGGTLLFSADGGNGRELWQTDGTAGGTMGLVDTWPGSSGSEPRYPALINGILYYSADDGTTGRELWRTDGTEPGTWQVVDLNAGPGDSNPGRFTLLNGEILFVANDGTNGFELWKTDGSMGNATLVKEFYAGSTSSMDASALGLLTPFHIYNGEAYFVAIDSTYGAEVRKTDGTTAGTVLLADIESGSRDGPEFLPDFTEAGGLLFFPADGSKAVELYVTDGTTEGTALLLNIVGLNPSRTFEESSLPENLTELNGLLIFTAFDYRRGRELWRTDGTRDGTFPLKDIYPGVFPLKDTLNTPAQSRITGLTRVGDRLYFAAEDGIHGRELWVTDGTTNGTVMVEDLHPGPASSNPQQLTVVDGALYYLADIGAHDLSLRTLREGNSPFDNWLDLTSTLTGEDRGYFADPNTNGFPNYVDFVLDVDPDEPGALPVVQILTAVLVDIGGETFLELTYDRRKNADGYGVVFELEGTMDFVTWYTADYLEYTTSLNTEFERVTLLILTGPEGAETSGFFRLKVVPVL